MSKGTGSFLRIAIDGFRAVHSADISLDGITVLSGINGSGKSTVSKMAYSILKSVNEYNDLVFKYLEGRLERIADLMDNLGFSIFADPESDDDFFSFGDFLRINSLDDLQELSDKVNSFCERVLDYYLNNENEEKTGKLLRYKKMIASTLDADSEMGFRELLNKLQDRINEEIAKAKRLVFDRPIELVDDEIKQEFEDFQKNVSLYEYGEELYGSDINRVPIPHFVRQVFYIDTPFAVDSGTSDNWIELHHAFQHQNEFIDSPLADSIAQDIIGGNAKYRGRRSFVSRYVFKDRQGREFDLEQCATGFKSFSILQMLLRNGYVKENTLLILDEPEAHLHPQWIIEYARIIVLIHKTIGTKFLVSSHSPDMVSAIRYIAASEDCLDHLSFYCAKEYDETPGTYSYEYIGDDIEPIFESFNMSYDRLDNYTGVVENEE